MPITIEQIPEKQPAPAAGVWLVVASGLGTNQEERSGPDGRYAVIWREFNLTGTVVPTIYARDLERNLAVSEDFSGTTTNLDLHLLPALTLLGRVNK